MYETRILNLQLFSDGGDGGNAGNAGEGGGSPAEYQIGDVLPDGTVMDENLASSMREFADLYRDQDQRAHAQVPAQGEGESKQQAEETKPAEPTREEWEEAKKKYAKFYGEDVHKTVNDRFKNQADANEQLKTQQPILDAIMKKTGVKTLEELAEALNSDELEREAEEKDIPVEILKQMKALEAENQRHTLAEENQRNREHIMGLMKQGEELQKLYPDFDLFKEMENPKFRNATSPQVGMTVEEAYLALHGKDLQAQIMAYGVQAGKEQTAQAVRANSKRPVEGANRGARSGAVPTGEVGMTEEMYEAIRNRTMQGEHVAL